MKRSIIIFWLVYLICSNAFAGYTLGEISDSHYVIYRAEDEEMLAEIKHSHRSWHLNCVNGVSFGSNYQTFDSRDMAVNIAGEQCKIGRKIKNMIT